MDEIRNRLNLVIAGRIVLCSVLIFSLHWTNFFKHQYELVLSFHYLLLVILAFSLLSLFLNRWLATHRKLIVCIHLAFDLSLATFIVFSTGVTGNPFFLLYIFIITYSSLFLELVGVLVVTVLACACIVTIHFVYYFLFSTTPSDMESLKSFLFSIEIYLLGYSLVGLLTGFLAERLRRTRQLMAQQSDRIQDLKDYNEYILASLRSGLLTTDIDFRIVKINRMGLEILEIHEEGAIGRDALALFTVNLAEQEELKRFTRSAENTLRTEKWIEFSADNAGKYIGLSVSPLLMRGADVAGYIFIFQDLTEIKRLQDEINTQKKMVAIGNLSAALAHEIRNPLASMMGSIQVLQKQLPSVSGQHLMDIVLRESRRLNRIVSNFLEFAGSGKFQPQSVDLRQVITETMTLVANEPDAAGKYRIDTDFRVESMVVYGDPDQLRQVFWNLSSNAKKAMPTGGTIGIRCLDDIRHFIVEFTDQGHGMSKQEIQNLFEPFYSRFKGGLGLGLAIVYRIIADHQGSIEVDSDDQSGTMFRIYLPKHQEGLPLS
ncbi:MAG: PAS domain S-box protein [Acidobacteria bacterium]|nr:PAS domain S-box protein [Acidobacteriota bacterium]